VKEGTSDLSALVASFDWYHSIELAPGIVTPGYFDTRHAARLVPMPRSLEGKRCLDVGTYDGFWAFEMERRGASEVVAVDVLDPRRWDWPLGATQAVRDQMEGKKERGKGFEVAREALGSTVERLDRSIYELDPSDLGEFDFVYVGSLLLHLRDPIGALERVRSVCRDQALLVDAIDPWLSWVSPRRPAAGLDGAGRPWWWRPNVAGLRRMAEAAGFETVEGPKRFGLRYGKGGLTDRIPLRALLSQPGRLEARVRLAGDPHAGVLVRIRQGADPSPRK